MAPWLVELDEAPVTQRILRRARVPPRRLEQCEGKAERRECERGTSLRVGAKRSDPRVQLHGNAEQQDIAFERRKPEAARKHTEGGRRIRCLRGAHALCGAVNLGFPRLV